MAERFTFDRNMTSLRVWLRVSLMIATFALQACQGSSEGASSDGSQRTMPDCPGGTYQCGYGCLSLSARCCTSQTDESTWDQGTSECPNALISSCNSNPSATCTGTVSGTINPMPASTYCCSTNSDVGSLDCTGGTVVCNLMCVAVGSTCCSLTNTSDCGNVGGVLASGGGGGGGSGSGEDSGGSGDWYYHWNCNGDAECLATNAAGQPSGTLDEGPVEVNCTQLVQFAAMFWGSAATDSCDQSPNG
jgi:hypothetical protein